MWEWNVILRSEKITIAMVAKSLKKNLHIKSLYDQNIISSFSEIFSYLRKSLAIFGNFGKMSGDNCLVFGQLLQNLLKSLESVRKIVKKVVIAKTE